MKKTIMTIILGLLVACGPSVDQTITVETVGNQMAYDTPLIEAKPGSTIRLIFKNNATIEVMKHNIVILNDPVAIDRVGEAALTAENYIPNDPAIVAYTPIVEPGEEVSITITLPESVGTYPFICTYPGHYKVMQGQIIIKK
jgi:azurin